MQKSVVIHGYYGAGNFGDDIILHSIIKSLNKKIKGVKVTVLSRDMFPIPAYHYGFKVVSRYNFNEMKKAIKSADMLICGGGGILQDYSGFDMKSHFTNKKNGIDYYGVPIELAYLYKVPVMLYAIGAGPLFDEKSRLNVKTILNWVDAVTVRDEESLATLKEIDPKKKIIVTSDPALNYLDESKNKSNSKKKYFGICIRDWYFRKYQREAFVKSLASAADYNIKKYNRNLVIFSFCKSNADLKILQSLKNKIKHKDRVYIEKNVTIGGAMKTISNMDYVIGMRLHSLITATSINKPVIGISYDCKIDNYMKRIGLDEYVIPLEGISKEKIVSQIDNINKNLNRASRKMKSKIDSLKNQEKENIDIAMQVLMKRG